MTPKKSPRIPAARAAVLDCLEACLQRGADLQEALDRNIKSHELDKRDTALATELAYGYLRLKGRNDFIVSSHLRRPKGIPANLRLAMGLAVHEMLNLDSVPDYATLDWCVEFAKKSFGTGLGKVVNGVLRSIQRLGDDVHKPEYYCDDKPSRTTFLSRYHSCPEWIVSLWIKAYGEDDAIDYLKASTEHPPLGLRLNTWMDPDRRVADQLSRRPDLIMNHRCTFAFPSADDELNALIDKGIVSRQSAASQSTVLALNTDVWPAPLWDACCGHGGKSFLLRATGKTPSLCSDLSAKRLASFREQQQFLNMPLPTILASAEMPPVHDNFLGSIFLDVPCTGLGVLSRRPDAKWKRRPWDGKKMRSLQAGIIDKASHCLSKGGLLAYVTCTLNPDENSRQIQRACQEHSSLNLVMEWETPSTSPLKEFFYAGLLRKG